MNRELILITGRTSQQGRCLHSGKANPQYQQAVSELEMNAEDMVALGLIEGQVVLVRSPAGEARVSAKAGQLPAGMAFLAMGPVASSLMSHESEGTGMPVFKGVGVYVLPLVDPELPE